MLIDFDEIAEVADEHYKGGAGALMIRAFADHGVKVMRCRLEKGCSIGLHTHENSTEVLYALSGTARLLCDGDYEILKAGSCFYCPVGHSHDLVNIGDEDFVFLTVVSDVK